MLRFTSNTRLRKIRKAFLLSYYEKVVDSSKKWRNDQIGRA